MKILVADIFYLDGEGKVEGPGFILIENGYIESIKEGEPTDEEKIVDLIVGGRGRLAIPGFGIGLIVPETYLFKGFSTHHPGDVLGGDLADSINKLTEDQSYYLAIATLYELAMNAFTRIILVSPHPKQVLKASQDAGLDVIVLIPLGCRLGKNIKLEYLDKYLSTDKAPRDTPYGLLICREELNASLEEIKVNARLVVYIDEDYHIVEFTKPFKKKIEISNGIEGSIYAPLSIRRVNPWFLLSNYYASSNATKLFNELTTSIHKFFENDYQPMKRGKSAHVAVINIREPPSWIPSKDYVFISSLGPTRPNVETLIVSNEVVIDGGEHLLLGRKVFEEAEKIF